MQSLFNAHIGTQNNQSSCFSETETCSLKQAAHGRAAHCGTLPLTGLWEVLLPPPKRLLHLQPRLFCKPKILRSLRVLHGTPVKNFLKDNCTLLDFGERINSWFMTTTVEDRRQSQIREWVKAKRPGWMENAGRWESTDCVTWRQMVSCFVLHSP